MIKRTVVHLALLVSSNSVFAQTQPSYAEQIDALFSDISDNTPGCSVGAIKQGELIHQAGYGSANLELNVPLDGNHIHRIASVSKQFTAMAVLLLADEGKIKLEDDIREHLPELRDYKNKVTINSMLGHFSGMGDYDFVDDLADEKAMDLRSSAGGPFRLGNQDYLSIKEFYDYVKTVPLRRAPDQQWEYSNYAYFLLSMLVEKVSGESLRTYSDKRIFKPLGMKHTFFSDDSTEIVANRASGYSKNKSGEYFTNMTNLFWVGDGGLHTNIEDMLLWDHYFYSPTLGKQPHALLKHFNTPNSQHLTRGSLYANGQGVEEKDDGKVFSHGGGWLGVATHYQRIPDKQLSAIVFCNDDTLNPTEYSKKIIEIISN